MRSWNRGRPGDRVAVTGILEFTRFSINRINVRGYPARYLGMLLRGDARVRTLDAAWIRAYIRAWDRDPPRGMWDAVRELGDTSRREYRALAEGANNFDYLEEPIYEIGGDVGMALAEARRDPLHPRVEAGECCGREALVYLDAAKLSTDAFIGRILRELGRARIVRARALGVRPESGEVLLEDGRFERAMRSSWRPTTGRGPWACPWLPSRVTASSRMRGRTARSSTSGVGSRSCPWPGARR